MHWRYCSLAINHRYMSSSCFCLWKLYVTCTIIYMCILLLYFLMKQNKAAVKTKFVYVYIVWIVWGHEQISKAWISNKRISQMQVLLAACRELAGDCNRLSEVLYVFEHETWYSMRHIPTLWYFGIPVIQWNLYKLTTKFCGLSRQVVFPDKENKQDFVKNVPGKWWNLCVFSKTSPVSLYRFHCIPPRIS